MKKALRPVIILFVIINCLAIVFRSKLEAKSVDSDVVIIGNLVIFIATLGASFLYLRSLASKNPQAIMRGVYGGFMLKFFIMLIAALAYIALVKPYNRPALFICMGLYLVYHFLGTQNVINQKKQASEGKTSL